MKLLTCVIIGFCYLQMQITSTQDDDFWSIVEEFSGTTNKATASKYDDDETVEIWSDDDINFDYQSCFEQYVVSRIEADVVADEEPFKNDDVLSNRESGEFRSGRKELHLWKSGRVPTVIDQNMSSRSRRLLKCAVMFFKERTCIDFVKRRPNDTDYIYITENDKRGGCFTESLGNVGGRHVVNLQKHNRHCWKHGTIIHELMHALGFYHEHSRNDRDDYIDIDWSIITNTSMKQYQTAKEQELDQILVGEYDFESVMHYTRYYDGSPVITAKVHPIADNNEKMGNRYKPTAMDLFKIKALYCGIDGISNTSYKPICEGEYKSIQTNYTFTLDYRTPPLDEVHPLDSRRCDFRDNIQEAWIKLEGDGGNKMLDQKPHSRLLCGTDYPGYIIGNHPPVLYQVVQRKLCYFNGYACNNTSDIQILNCGHNQFLYKIDKSPHCNMAFCTGPRPQSGNCIKEDNMDIVGGRALFNIEGVAESACCAFCHNTKDCKAYAWNDHLNGTCWLKSATEPKVRNPGTKIGIINDVKPTKPPGFSSCTKLDNKDIKAGHSVGDIHGQPEHACCLLCAQTQNCRAYAWNSYSGGTCWLKSETHPISDADGVKIGILN